MATAPAWAPQPCNEAARSLLEQGRASTIFINNGDSTDNPEEAKAQHLALVPRIILTHWLRPDEMEAANG